MALLSYYSYRCPKLTHPVQLVPVTTTLSSVILMTRSLLLFHLVFKKSYGQIHAQSNYCFQLREASIFQDLRGPALTHLAGGLAAPLLIQQCANAPATVRRHSVGLPEQQTQDPVPPTLSLCLRINNTPRRIPYSVYKHRFTVFVHWGTF